VAVLPIRWFCRYRGCVGEQVGGGEADCRDSGLYASTGGEHDHHDEDEPAAECEGADEVEAVWEKRRTGLSHCWTTHRSQHD